MKPGTEVNVLGWDVKWVRTYERATVLRARRDDPPPPGFIRCRYESDGSVMLVPADRIEVAS